MELVVTLAALIALPWKVVDWAKLIVNKHWSGVFTQAVAWVAGVFTLLLGSNSDAFEGYTIPGMTKTLGELNSSSLILLGIAMMSAGSVAYDFKKALDGSDSAHMPHLIPDVVATKGHIHEE